MSKNDEGGVMKRRRKTHGSISSGSVARSGLLCAVLSSLALFLSFGCAGGGTGGTDGGGSVKIIGLVLQDNEQPLSSGKVTILETGDSSLVTSSGSFEFPAVSVPETTINLEVEGTRGNSTVLLDKVTPDIAEVEVTVKVSRDQRNATIRRRVDKPRPKKPTPQPRSTPDGGSPPPTSPTPGDPGRPVKPPVPTAMPTPTSPVPSGFPGANSERVLFVPFLLNVEGGGTPPTVTSGSGAISVRQLANTPSEPIWYGFSTRVTRALRRGPATSRFEIQHESTSFSVTVGPFTIPTSRNLDPIPLYLFRSPDGSGALALFSPDSRVSVTPFPSSPPTVVGDPPANRISEVKFVAQIAPELNAASVSLRQFPSPRLIGVLNGLESLGFWGRYLGDYVSAPPTSVRISISSTDGTSAGAGIASIVLPEPINGQRTIYLSVTPAIDENGTRTGLNVQQVAP